MKIAVLCGHYPYSGAGVVAWESARALSRRHEVTFVHGADRAGDFREGDSVQVDHRDGEFTCERGR